MRRLCVGVLGLEAREAQGPVNIASLSLDSCHAGTSPPLQNPEWSLEEQLVIKRPHYMSPARARKIMITGEDSRRQAGYTYI